MLSVLSPPSAVYRGTSHQQSRIVNRVWKKEKQNPKIDVIALWRAALNTAVATRNIPCIRIHNLIRPYNITPPPSADRVEMRHHPVGTATTARLVVVCSSSAVSFIKENCWIASKYYSPTLDRLTYSETLGAFFIFIDGDDYLLCVCVSCP